MTDKFAYWAHKDKNEEAFSQYVHENVKIIITKMMSEMRRKLHLTPGHTNEDGYLSMLVSIQGRVFNECVYSLMAICQSLNMKLSDIVPLQTIGLIVDMMEGKNPLEGRIRSDVKEDKAKFQESYQECIDKLRACVEALPPSE